MFVKGSRYGDARSFVPGEGGGEPFPGVRPREIGLAEGVIEHTVRAGDRLDLLARHYYDDPRLWWRVLDANPDLLCAAGQTRPAMVGRVIAIPRARE